MKNLFEALADVIKESKILVALRLFKSAILNLGRRTGVSVIIFSVLGFLAGTSAFPSQSNSLDPIRGVVTTLFILWLTLLVMLFFAAQQKSTKRTAAAGIFFSFGFLFVSKSPISQLLSFTFFPAIVLDNHFGRDNEFRRNSAHLNRLFPFVATLVASPLLTLEAISGKEEALILLLAIIVYSRKVYSASEAELS